MMEQLFNLLISNAYGADAQGVANAQGSSGFSFAMIFIVFFIAMYFAIWRPQNKRAKEQQTLLGSLSKGDEVLTAGGLIGRITKITDHYLSLAVANNVDILIQKSSVVNLLPKGTIKSIE